VHAETPETLPCVSACAQLGPDGKVGSADIKIGTRTVALQADSLTYAQAENTPRQRPKSRQRHKAFGLLGRGLRPRPQTVVRDGRPFVISEEQNGTESSPARFVVEQ